MEEERQANPTIMQLHQPWIEVDGVLQQLNGSFFGLVPSGDSHGPSITADDKKKQVSEKKNFRVQFDVRHFSPKELSVRVVGRDVVIEGQHEDREDNYGLISRSFTRKFALPEDVDEKKVFGQLSKDGKLFKVEAPKKEDIQDTPKEGMVASQSESAQGTSESDNEKDEDYDSMSE
jgi:HSP20 family molecular chaperone IbpA